MGMTKAKAKAKQPDAPDAPGDPPAAHEVPDVTVSVVADVVRQWGLDTGWAEATDVINLDVSTGDLLMEDL